MARQVQLVLLTALGADERLFAPQREAFPEMVVPAWIPPQNREGLADYAARLAETIHPVRPFVLGGVSLGGMVAYELARLLVPDAVVLIASCRRGRRVRPFLRYAGRLAAAIPHPVWAGAKALAPLAIGFLAGATMEQRKLLVRMFRAADPRFMRWAVGAIVRWEPPPLNAPPVLQVHGARDLLIPLAEEKPDLLIPEGGHLVNLTHAQQVNGFLARVIEAGGSGGRQVRPDLLKESVPLP